MKPIDLIPEFAPQRKAEKVEGGWLVTVTPPIITQLPANSLKLTDDQYNRYLLWQDNKVLIQTALPELSNAEREILITGIGDEDFQRIAAEPTQPCPACAGTGGLYASHGGEVLDQPCQTCDGTGEVVADDIEVPCVDGTENHEWVVSDDNENDCYCSRCGTREILK